MNKNKKVVFITGTPGVGKTTVAEYLNNKLNKKYISKLFKINEIATENDLIQGKDSERGYQIVDIEKLNKKLFEIINNDNIENLNLNNINNKNSNEKNKNNYNLKNNENTKSYDLKNNEKNNENTKSDDLKNNEKNNENIESGDLKISEIAIVEGHLSHLCDNCDKIIVLRLNPEILEKRLEKRDYLKSKIEENLEAESLAVCSVEAFQKHGSKVNEIDTTGMSIEEVASDMQKIIFNEKEFPVGKIDFMDWLIQ